MCGVKSAGLARAGEWCTCTGLVRVVMGECGRHNPKRDGGRVKFESEGAWCYERKGDPFPGEAFAPARGSVKESARDESISHIDACKTHAVC